MNLTHSITACTPLYFGPECCNYMVNYFTLILLYLEIFYERNMPQYFYKHYIDQNRVATPLLTHHIFTIFTE